MNIGVIGSIEYEPEASDGQLVWVSHESVMCQSRVSHESVTSDFWGCDYRTPVGHEGWRGRFFQRNFMVTIRWVNWTCLNTFGGQTRYLNFWKILGWTPSNQDHCRGDRQDCEVHTKPNLHRSLLRCD
jgi:hypothetical protein